MVNKIAHSLAARIYVATEGQELTVCDCDFNEDGIVNILDFALIARTPYICLLEACKPHFGKKCPKHGDKKK